jgi:hypothetical protein
MLHNLFFQILLCTQIGDHQPKDLTKFGNRLIMQVIYFIKSSYISAKIWLFEKKKSKFVEFGICFHKKSSVHVKIIFSGSKNEKHHFGVPFFV